MEPEESGRSLSGRLEALVARRNAFRHCGTSSSDGEEAQASGSQPSSSGALQALRDLLASKTARLREVQADLEEEGGQAAAAGATDPLQQPCGPFASRPPSAPRAPQGAPSLLPQAITEAAAPLTQPSPVSSCPSMPPTARLIIATEHQVAGQAAAAGRAERTHELALAGAAAAEAEAEQRGGALDTMLAEQAAAGARRAAARRAAEEAMLAMQGECARQHIAARRISHAWRAFLRSPSRLREVAAATSIQAAWRGAASRTRTAALARRRRLLRELRAAAGGGGREAVLALARQLAAEGEGAAAHEAVQAFEAAATAAAQALQAAAAGGTAEEHRAAAVAAGRFDHLGPALAAAAAAFGARADAARRAVLDTAREGTLAQLQEAAARAAPLGLPPEELRRAEAELGARDLGAAQALRAALEACPYNAAAFEARLAAAQRFGLLADAARAQRALLLRRERAAAALAAAAAGGGAQELAAAAAEATALGLVAEAEAAVRRMDERRAAAATVLQRESEAGGSAAVEAAERAAAALGVDSRLLAACRRRLEARQAAAVAAVRGAAAGGSAAEFRQARRQCLALGQGQAADAALAVLEARRREAGQLLASSTRALCEAAGRAGGGAALEAAAAAVRQLLPASGGWRRRAEPLVCTAGGVESGASAAPLAPAVLAWAAAADAAWDLELGRQARAAAGAADACLAAVVARARQPALELRPGAAAAPDLILQHHGCRPCAGSRAAGGRGAAAARDVLACFRRWQAAQGPVLAALAGLELGGPGRAEAAAESEVVERRRSGGGAAEGARREVHLDFSGQGLASLDPLASCTSLRSLDLGGNALTSLEGLSALTGLAALSLDANRLASAAGLAGLARLTRLSLAGNPLPDLATLPLLPSLLHLDLRGAGLTSLAGLGGAAPLLRALRAERNRLQALPPDLGLLWLSELRLDGNTLEGYSAGGGGGGSSSGPPPWPWLPSLRALHLRGCGLAAPPQPAHRLGAPTQLDLSSNALASLGGCLAALAPLAPSLRRLQLEGNPLAGAGAGAGRGGGGGGGWPGGPYPAAVLAALPGLQELDRRPVPAAERQAHLQLLPRRRLLGAGAQHAAHVDADAVWEASTLLWALSSSEAARAAALHASQQQRLGVQRSRRSGSGSGCSSSGGSSDGDGEGGIGPGPLQALVAGLELLQSLPRQQSLAGNDPGSSTSEAADLRRRHWVLASTTPGALQDLEQLRPAYFGAMLSRLARAANAIQRWWRGHAARLLHERLAAQREHERRRAAAAALQAAWRGWAARRRHDWVRGHLERWRADWHAAQAALEAHVRGVAATRLQAAWRGRRVRAALARARAAVRAQLVAAAHEDGDGLDDELVAEESSLAGLLDGLLGASGGTLGSPETLRPELAVKELGSKAGPAAAAAAMVAALGPVTAGMRSLLPPEPAGSGGSGGGLPPAVPRAGGAAAAAPAAPAAGAPGHAASDAGWAFSSEATAAAFAQLRARQAAQARKREVRELLRDPEARLQAFQQRNHLPPPSPGPGAAAGPVSQGWEVGVTVGQQQQRRGRSSRQLPPTVFHSSGGSAADRLDAGTASPTQRCSLPPLCERSHKAAVLHPHVLQPYFPAL